MSVVSLTTRQTKNANEFRTSLNEITDLKMKLKLL